MTEVVPIAELRNRLRNQRTTTRVLDTESPAQVAGRLEALGYSTRTARNAAEIACAVAASLREGKMVSAVWGE